jgi:phosphoribosylformylglycinamidine synthase
MATAAARRPFGFVDLYRQVFAMKARVTVTLKNGVLDPQGKAIEGALGALGFAGIGSVRQGKVFDIEVEGTDAAKAKTELEAMAAKLLANTVIENYRVEIVD